MHTKKMMKLLFILFLNVLFGMAFLLTSENSVVEAAPTTLHALDSNTRPSGVKSANLIDNTDSKTDTIFRPLTYIDSTGQNMNSFPNGNSNSLVSPVSNGFSNVSYNKDTGTFGLWGRGTHQAVVWSNDNYRINLDKDQYFSFWIWGNENNPVGALSTGGFAFVIQNDPQQQNAYSYDNANGSITDRSKLKYAPDETLGAFAADQNLPHLSNAIQNSWALSFDMHPNTSGDINDAFDDGVYLGIPAKAGNVYISSGYPAQSSTYLSGIIGGGYSMPRSSVDVGNLDYTGGVGMWHHVRILYQAPENGGDDANITYWYDDIFEDGSANTNSGDDAVSSQANPKMIERTYPVDLKNLNVTKDSSGKRLARWGFVGRNSTTDTTLNVVLETASPVLSMTITPQVIDVTQDNRVLTPSNEYVNSGDKLIFRYGMKYNSGVSNWSNVKSFIKIPDGTIADSSNYGQITFGNTSEPLTGATYNNNLLQYNFTKALGPDESTSMSNTATMDINTTAQVADNTELKVNGVENYFNGDYYIGHSKTQDFIIRGKQTKNLELGSTSASKIEVATGGNVELNGSLKYDNDTAFVDPGAEVYLTVNGKAHEALNVPIVSGATNKTLDISDVISKELTQEFADGKLNSGDNIVTVYARDSLGNKSNTLTFTINVLDKTVDLIVDPAGYSFKDIQALETGLIQRKGSWKVNVYSVNSAWNLNASATKMTTDYSGIEHTFDGELVYKKDQNIFDMAEPIPITSASDAANTVTTIIGDNWQPNEGILLKSNGGTDAPGQYSGTIKWDLVQAP